MRILLAAIIGIAIAWLVGYSISAQGSTTVSGRVLDPDGNPSPDIFVDLCEPAYSNCVSVAADADGRFEFNPSAGSYLISTTDPLNGRPLSYLEGGNGNLSWHKDVYTLIETGSDSASGIEITLPSPTEVSGIVRNSDGNLDAGVTIALCERRSRSCHSSTTDSTGRFSLVVPRDDYLILFRTADHSFQGVYDPNSPRGIPEDPDNPGVLVVRRTPLTEIMITLPEASEFERTSPEPPVEAAHTISGRLRYSSGRPAAGAEIRVCGIPSEVCIRVRTAANGAFGISPELDSGRYEIRIEAGSLSGYYSEQSPGSFSETEDHKTVLNAETGSITDLEIRIPLLPRIAGRVLNDGGFPSAATTVHACREIPRTSCVTSQSDANGHFAIDVTEGDYYVAFTIGTNERWYYHAGSDGRLISTDRRPERTFVTVPSAEAADLTVRIPERDFARIIIHDLHRGRALNANVKVSICREDWHFGSVLPQCLIPSEAMPPAGAHRALNAPVPAEPHYIRFEFIGYAVGGPVYWYYDEDSPSGISSDWLRRTTFPGGDPPVHPLQVQLPDLPRSIPVRLDLSPGANLVGWPGGRISLTELARQVPELKGVIRVSRDPGAPPQAYAVNDPGAPDIITLSRWWFYADLDEPRSILIDTPPHPNHQPHPYGGPHHWFPEGESLLVWTGAQPVTLEQATAGLGELREPPRLLRWTGTELEQLEAGLVRQGDLIRVDSPRRFLTPLPFPWQPFYVLNGPADHEWGQVAHRLQAVQAFFWERYGVIQNNFTLFYRTSPDPYHLSYLLEGRCGWSSTVSITLTCADPHSIARQYFRLLQWQMLGTRNLNQGPAWLIEGMMEYAAAIYTHHAERSSGDPLASYWETVRSGFNDQRGLTDLPSDFRFWGDDRAATILSTVAVDRLLKQSGNPDALLDFHRRAYHYFGTIYADEEPDHDWQRAFAEAFGISADDFYERFADYRANGFE